MSLPDSEYEWGWFDFEFDQYCPPEEEVLKIFYEAGYNDAKESYR
jgi:hypothetical protein